MKDLLGDKIVFPLNGKRYFEKGTEAFEKGEREKAIKYLDKAFKYTNNTEVNLYYAFVLSVYEDYKKTLEVMNQKKDFYINNEKQASFYTEILIKNEHFLEAEYIIQKYLLNLTTVPKIWKKLEEELDAERKMFNIEEKERKRELIKSLSNLSADTSLVQSKKIKEAETLDLETLQKLAAGILIDYQIDAKVRRAFLELLVRRKDKKSYSFLWFEQVRELCPANLKTFDDIDLVHELKARLKEKLIKYPDLYYLIDTEMTHDLLLLYPYIDEVIEDLDFWLDLYIVKLDFYNHSNTTRMAVTKEELKMKETVEYLHIISQRNQIIPKN